MTSLRRLVTAVALLAVLALPAGAAAQFEPVSPSSPAPQPTQTVVASPNSSDDGGGLQRWQELLLFAGGLALLAGIGFAIVDDARRHAPVGEDEGRPGAHEAGVSGSHKPRDKARAKQQRKRARAARKRNAARR